MPIEEVLSYYSNIISKNITENRSAPHLITINFGGESKYIGVYFYDGDMFILCDGMDYSLIEFYETFGDGVVIDVVMEFENGRFVCDNTFQG